MKTWIVFWSTETELKYKSFDYEEDCQKFTDELVWTYFMIEVTDGYWRMEDHA